MDTGSFWETLWAALTSVALIVAALGFIAKRAFDQALKRDLEKYKSALAAEMQRHKSDLDKDLEAHKNNLKIAGDKELEIIRGSCRIKYGLQGAFGVANHSIYLYIAVTASICLHKICVLIRAVRLYIVENP